MKQADMKKYPTEEDWEKMLLACMEAILKEQSTIILEVSTKTKLPADFPVGKPIAPKGRVKRRIVYAKKLLYWLEKHGHAKLTSQDLFLQKRNMLVAERELYGPFEM